MFDPCARTSQDEYCTTVLYHLSVDTLKKKNKQQGRQRQGRDGVSVQMTMVYVMYILSHVKTERNCSLLNNRRLLKAVSCHHWSFPFVPPSAIPRKRNPNFSASARVRNPSRCLVKRSAVLFFVSTRFTNLLRASIVCCIVAIFDCRHVLLGGVSLHRHGVFGVPQRA